ncbi:MAG TPA: 50S ribosomal protein L22 [Candidatus Paceibacterota bacterium]|nr:50S ribosomal protein L22 [Candidatus Paceibacterota bacterium]
MTLVKAQLNTLRISPRKVRLVAGLIKGKRADAALDQLMHLTKRSVAPLTKLLRSGIANAQSTAKLDSEHLWIKSLMVDEGVKLKRWIPKGFGRAKPIHKKTSKISLVLEHRQPKEAKAEPTT